VKECKMTSLREMLEQLPTDRLDEMLRTELKKEPLDDNTVRLILDVLREREAGVSPEMTPAVQKAWENYIAGEDRAKANQAASQSRNRVLKAASVAVVLGMLFFVVPQQAKAENFLNLLARWTDSLFSFFSPGISDSGALEYEFRTDNPGLQQVYDAAVEMGITEPTVPMWLPVWCILAEMKIDVTPTMNCIIATFSDGEKEAVLQITNYNLDVPFEYHKDKTEVTMKEVHGTEFYVLRNIERWSVTWRRENIECIIVMDCQENEIDKILRSIFTMEAE